MPRGRRPEDPEFRRAAQAWFSRLIQSGVNVDEVCRELDLSKQAWQRYWSGEGGPSAVIMLRALSKWRTIPFDYREVRIRGGAFVQAGSVSGSSRARAKQASATQLVLFHPEHLKSASGSVDLRLVPERGEFRVELRVRLTA